MGITRGSPEAIMKHANYATTLSYGGTCSSRTYRARRCSWKPRVEVHASIHPPGLPPGDTRRFLISSCCLTSRPFFSRQSTRVVLPRRPFSPRLNTVISHYSPTPTSSSTNTTNMITTAAAWRQRAIKGLIDVNSKGN